MVSKQLESIISSMPLATVPGKEEQEKFNPRSNYENTSYDKKKIVKVVAAVPEYIKDELQEKARTTGETEKTIILKALKAYGFSIDDDALVDQRTLRK
ncbi:MAG: hypothetical protein LBU35_03335 [Holosporales bacterium]|jgi:hypothetical protein|nr:hypothetical protein [Holosporales bacterium]